MKPTVLTADVIAATAESITFQDRVVRHDGTPPDGTVTYVLGPVIADGARAAFASASDGSRWVADDEVSALVVRSHRLHTRDPWLFRWVQMVEAYGFAWDEPDGSTLCAHAAYVGDKTVYFLDPTTHKAVHGLRSRAAADRWRYAVVVAGEDGDTIHDHDCISGGAALALAALYLARFGGRVEAVDDRRLAAV